MHRDNTSQALAEGLIAEARRRLAGESLPRLVRAISELDDTELWLRPNSHTVSAGNLVLHLAGNVRQWILSGLGGAPDERQRDREFAETGPLDRAQLLERLERSVAEADATLARLGPADLLREHVVQGFRETGLSIVVHVVEHFSYHVGQVSYIVKATRDIDLGYYAGVDLDQRSGGGS